MQSATSLNCSNKVLVDLDRWEARLDELAASNDGTVTPEVLFDDFPGPLLHGEPLRSWTVQPAARIRETYLGLAVRVAATWIAEGRHDAARDIYLRTLDLYPDSTRAHEALIGGRLAQADISGALEDYARYEEMRKSHLDMPSQSAIRALVAAYLSG